MGLITTVEERRMVRRRRGSLFSCLSLVAPTLLDAYEYSISLERTAPVDRETSGWHGSYLFWAGIWLILFVLTIIVRVITVNRCTSLLVRSGLACRLDQQSGKRGSNVYVHDEIQPMLEL